MSDVEDLTRSHEPTDRLTTMAGEMCEDLPDDVKAIVMLTDDDKHGVALIGWDEDLDAIVHMFMHLKAIMQANGTKMSLMTEDGVII